ncbi:helix-turn-helix transcriptional regulator [Nocardia brasiliensis]|uniref:helix-turn-helix transcriptional regulator n=1 Tax=Nocardia brasiliensis TaxID=37326 RepID=UPI0004A76EBB|nr:helix-turn-helix transcriptional regulator [Nocardia brasiliensis]MBF6130645.1 helix-turn-helix domain-containing protein [Nocardia brasiliensis]
MTDVLDVRAVRKARRAELGTFLKSRRAKISPDDVGLPPGPRRRTPGLRREEVAQLSGIGVTWYTWLEQGRQINVSVQVLDAVARTLALDDAERAHLYRLAEVPTVPNAHTNSALPEEMQTILDHLVPLPAALLSARYDMLAYNAAYEALCPGFLVGERNVARLVFMTPQCCNTYRHSWDDLRRMVAYLRGAYAKNLDDPSWQQFIEEMCTESADFATLWARNDVAVPNKRIKQIRHLAVGDLEMFVTSMSLPAVQGAWVQIYTPTDETQWARLHALLAMSKEEQRRPWLEHRERYHAPAAAG